MTYFWGAVAALIIGAIGYGIARVFGQEPGPAAFLGGSAAVAMFLVVGCGMSETEALCNTLLPGNSPSC
ncbi:hypothetical protein GCM10022224_061940 [Nonomuraea antimicrobica]|uniref:Uncharacterized protein n=1 Tax=Nonomuraea antimicrobica TaxID=561173 RepID=A0ABP7CDH9_9ACTN